MKYSKTIQITILIAILTLLIVASVDLVLLYKLTDLVIIKALFSFIIPYIISGVFKELKKQSLLPKIPRIKIFPKIKQRKPPKL